MWTPAAGQHGGDAFTAAACTNVSAGSVFCEGGRCGGGVLKGRMEVQPLAWTSCVSFLKSSDLSELRLPEELRDE